jgi:hypothetical protein
VRTSAPAEADVLTLPAAGLVSGHDLNDEGSVVLAAIPLVEQIAVFPVQGEADMDVVIVLTLGKADRASCSHAVSKDTQASRIADVLQRIAVSTALCCISRHRHRQHRDTGDCGTYNC